MKNSAERCLAALQEVHKEIVKEGNHKVALSHIARKNRLQLTFGPKLIEAKIVTRVGEKRGASYFWNVDVIPNIKMAEKLDDIMRRTNLNNVEKVKSYKAYKDYKAENDRKVEAMTEEGAVTFLLSKGYKVYKQVVQWEELK